MDIKWSKKTPAQKVRYVCGATLTVFALFMLIMSEIEPSKYALSLSVICVSVGNMLRDWDFLKSGDKARKLTFALSIITLILAVLLLLRKLF